MFSFSTDTFSVGSFLLVCSACAAITIPCPQEMCKGRTNGNYEYIHPNKTTYSNPAFFVTCSNGFASCNHCWPMSLYYSEFCDQCLWSGQPEQCWPPRLTGKVPYGWTEWSTFTDCSEECGVGIKTRTRRCRRGRCAGSSSQVKQCMKRPCSGKQLLADILKLSLSTLERFVHDILPNTKITARLHRAIFQIQRAVSLMSNLRMDDLISGSLPSTIRKLHEILIKAVHSDALPFARSTLGKLLYLMIKDKIDDNTKEYDIIVAAVEELRLLRERTGIEFDEIFTSDGEATLMFTMDTTGSMKNEIQAAKSIASAIVHSVKSHPIDCILSPFNDPKTGPVTKTSEMEKCVSHIDNLEAELGGDCPERAYTGMIDAIKAGPKFGSPMFVFTDAAAKDSTLENIAALKQLAEDNAVAINFLLTSSNCLMNESEYVSIASSTNGQIFPLSEQELPNLVAYIKTSLFIDTSIAIGRSESATKVFDVDTDIVLLMVTVTVKSADTAKYVKLISPKSDSQPANVTLSTVRIFEVIKPQAGQWSLMFPKVVGNLTFNVEAITDRPVEFAFNFLAEINDRMFTVYNPVANEDNTLIIRVAGHELVNTNSLRLDVIDELGHRLQQDLMLNMMGSANSVFNTSFVPPSLPFKLVLRGVKKDGSHFQRVSRQLVMVQSSFLQVAKAGNESTVKIREKNAPIKIQIVNPYPHAMYNFKLSSNFGRLSASKISRKVRHIDFIQVTYDAPKRKRFIGKVDTISISSTAPGLPTNYYTFELFLVA